ncbi:TetR/AcrR family transcriptional regulator [Clostridium sp. YIM B02505]|uniref:TetR/AcrR family transcriptional regulator n=1 Tax=Clostridium yunnanense TaxID=2800325 RepID=A0ABS1ESA8_9CLOT|nr:TetR/AcrR family transcriptional regulator [Clostridium yunnanense]
MGKKEQIVDAVVELIMELGFANFSVGKVANKLNVSKGVITYHFPTKDLLLQSAVANYYEEAAMYMEQHIRVDKNSMDTLNSYIESCLYFARKKKKETIAIVDIILNSRTEDGKALFNGEDDSIYQPLIEIFKYGQEIEKSYRDFSREIMARCVRSIIDSVSLAIAKDEIKDVDEAVEEVKSIFESATVLR